MYPPNDLHVRLEQILDPAFRDQLLAKGMARGLIWQNGNLPSGAPGFSRSLSEDLLDYGHGVMALALQLRRADPEDTLLKEAFRRAGEAIEAAVHRGPRDPAQSFHRVTAGTAFHLARYSARAYSILSVAQSMENVAPNEDIVVRLLRRRLDQMRSHYRLWLLDEGNQDWSMSQRLRDDESFGIPEAIHTALTSSLMRGMALFDHALTTGRHKSAEDAIARLKETARIAKGLHAVSHWWTATLARHLIEELWHLSLHQQIPHLPAGHDGRERWRDLRLSFIQRLRANERATIELWPSQLEASQRAIDPSDDLVIALPTSAGKTRIAELCILRTLAADQRVIYVTPLRALSAQIERDLADTFLPLGFSVSSLYGAAGIETADQETLRDGHIVITTPEKLDFALRNDGNLISDVGLIVLDEGHMLGKGEREVRYEALVQRLLRRSDAQTRRIICLSALFPSPEEMRDMVAWLRQDEPGDAVHSTWRPTRRRFGVIRWRRTHARLELEVGPERPFVPRFVEAVPPPPRSRRRNHFPNNKNELTLATAWQFIGRDMRVLVYCALRRSVETLGRLILSCINQGVLSSLQDINQNIRDAISTGTEWLGEDHPAVRCLEYGVALHHAGLPRPFLNHVERILRSGDCRLIIASPTLSQGLNLSASVLLIPSIWRNQQTIPPHEFSNVAGRAGRAFVDVEGLVLHVVWDKQPYSVRKWNRLIRESTAPLVRSGLLLLTLQLYNHLARNFGVDLGELIEYVTGNDDAWEYTSSDREDLYATPLEWDRDVASLDSALLALLDLETQTQDVALAFNNAVEGSLFERQLLEKGEQLQRCLRHLAIARAHHIWKESEVGQRRGYYAAGVGLKAGKFMDVHLPELTLLLKQIERAIRSRDPEEVALFMVGFAELVFETTPFRPPKPMPSNWKQALQMWIRGELASDVVAITDNKSEGVNLLQEALTYRLPWAMEAVRVHASAIGQEGSQDVSGFGAMAVQAGSANPSVIQLLRSGLSSREAAIAAAVSTAADFDDRGGMFRWLNSEPVLSKYGDETWPTARSRHAWVSFLEGRDRQERRAWSRTSQHIPAIWSRNPKPGAHVVIEPSLSQDGTHFVLTPDYYALGELLGVPERPIESIVEATVGESADVVTIEYFGPPRWSNLTSDNAF